MAPEPGNSVWVEYYNSSGTEYSYDSEHKYVKLTAVPFALIGNTTINGTAGMPLSEPQTVEITLYLDRVKTAISNAPISGWFNNLPLGITVMADASENGKIITLALGGTPATHSTAAFDITISSDVLLSDAVANVETNPNAKFGINPHPHTWGGWESDADEHWHECTCGETKGMAAHTPGDWVIDTPATATTDGSRHKECTVCGYIIAEEVIPTTENPVDPTISAE